MLMSDEIPRGSICTTNATSARIEDLQFALGEGPCIDAYNHGRPILEPDLADPIQLRWPAFSAAAIEAGVGAIFGFPLHIGAVRLGALNLYRDEAGPLTDDQHANALMMAEVATQAILELQAKAAPGTVAVELDSAADFHLAVHGAAGMVAAQLNIGIAQALIRLRAYAFGNNKSLKEVSSQVLARTLRFSDEK